MRGSQGKPNERSTDADKSIHKMYDRPCIHKNHGFDTSIGPIVGLLELSKHTEILHVFTLPSIQ